MKKSVKFPLGGVAAWSMPLAVFLALMFLVPPPDLLGFLLVALTFFYVLPGVMLFLGCDWSQQRWNPEGKGPCD
ncbi:hypothetical protein CR155_20370 [Pollutimonas nitritireducens]|uniref:Uncharacterized protein n=1 Tax=Pollutimonas nitritireducens TaxID=2045209 RepID=A0A2N4UAF7_9BURK|nr:hypothetical protein [Pollutimonas nitritireducens]PLC52005.1 hypothetical protein CR155_20370 [Pollutimonas nitritireducens]